MTAGGTFALIAKPAELAAGVRRWSAANEIALDTEFVFERTFRPRPGLVQLACDGEVALIDVVALPDLAPLGELLESAAIRKYVHAGAADVELVRRLAGAVPRPLFDTQVAAAFAGLGSGLSYAALVQATQGVELAKSETRTDWTRRPLAAEQLRYAAEDVSHLLPAARELRRRLDELGRLAWAEEESASAHATLESLGEGAGDRRLRGVDRLPPRAQAIARRLAAWRERTAERLDLARPFLLRDETLLALARREQTAPEELRRLPGYDARRHAQHGASWLDALAAAAAAVDASAPAPPPLPKRSREARERLELLTRAIAEAAAGVARERDLPPELLLPRRLRQRLAEALERGDPPAAELDGFRRQLLADPLSRLAV
jgi:ribonuclease D